jgi:hypothetical protein
VSVAFVDPTGPPAFAAILAVSMRGLDSDVGSRMTYLETEHLRVLIANERKDRLDVAAAVVDGHRLLPKQPRASRRVKGTR